MDHRLGDQQPPLHSARQRARMRIALVGEAHRLEQLLAAAVRLGDAVEPALVLEHLERGEEGIEEDLLRNDADRALGVAVIAVDVEPPDRRAAGGLGDQPRQNVDQRRLSRAVRAEQAEDLPFGHVEADPVERQLARRRPVAGVALHEVADRDGGRGAGHRAPL